MAPAEELSGTIERTIFASPENGFSVLVLVTKNKQSTIITGSLAHIQPGEQVTLQGTWKMHPKFGKQFEVTQCSTSAPTSLNGLKKYLGSGMIKGIGPVYAEKLVDRFGMDVLTIIEQEPERLQEVRGLGPARVRRILDAWQDQKAISEIMIFLQERGISTSLAIKIYKQYGQRSLAVLNENPYQLIDDLWGVGFKTADKLAQQLGIEPLSLSRIKAAISHVMSTIVGNGHLYSEIDALKAQTVELLAIDQTVAEPLLKLALNTLYQEEKIKLITDQQKHFITLSQYYFSEKGVANKIRRLLEQKENNQFDIDEIYKQLRVPKPQEVALNENQQRGIMACLQNKITIITGGPGTGKTTMIKQLLSILDEHKQSYRLAAPTGRAAKRMQEGTGRYAMTIHRMLEYDFMSRQFKHNESNALKLNFLIIDEASMVDIFLAHAIVKALPWHAHVVFIGDVDQLPSVGAGNFLNDLIASNIATTIKLTEIFRQAADSMIIVNAHRVNHGEFPTTSLPDAKHDFIFIKEAEPEMVTTHLTRIFTKQLAAMGISHRDAAVLVPMNRGIVGTQKINYDLQQLLNPQVTEQQLTVAGTTFKVGDRVMQIRNNYDKLVFNGDTGYIVEIDRTEQNLAVFYGDRTVTYEFSEADELMLAYAISIHKSQGSEYSAAIIPIFTCHFALLQRNLIYTAITRAKKVCFLIGQPKAIAIAIKNNKGIIRKTFLQEFLTSDLSCR